MNVITKLLILIVFVGMYGCQTSQELIQKSQIFDNSVEQTKAKISSHDGDNQQSYIKVLNSQENLLNKKIDNILVNDIELRNLLNLVFPDAYIITEGKGISLNQKISIDGKNLTQSEFLELLSSLSGYRIELEKANKLSISSVAYRRWNVASLVSLPEVETTVGGLSTGDAGNSTQITISKDDETWEDLLAGLEKILGEGGVIVDHRRLGEIYAAGNPDRLVLADQWMKKIVESSTRQILLDVAIVEVTLNDGEATGLDWKAIYTKNANSNISLERTALQNLPGSGAWDLVTNYTSGKFQLTSLVNLLKQHGKVSVQHQPSLTVTNGSTAYLGSTEQFSYLAGFEREEVTSATDRRTIIYRPEVVEIQIGVNIAVTARILENDNILIEVVPVISALQGFDELSFNAINEDQALRVPKISLQELSTQVITKSGQSVHLGGLVIEKLSESSSKLPTGSKFLNLLSNSQKQELEKREVLIIVTPTEV